MRSLTVVRVGARDAGECGHGEGGGDALDRAVQKARSATVLLIIVVVFVIVLFRIPVLGHGLSQRPLHYNKR